MTTSCAAALSVSRALHTARVKLSLLSGKLSLHCTIPHHYSGMMLTRTLGCEIKDIPGRLPPDQVPDDADLEHAARFAASSFKDLRPEACSDEILWRDWMSLSGRTQTFCGSRDVLSMWTKAIAKTPISNVHLLSKRIFRAPGTSWVSVSVAYNTTNKNGMRSQHSANIALVPSKDSWCIWMLVTILECVEGFGHPDEPQIVPPRHPQLIAQGLDYSVAIIGGGQGGLALAGRLKALNIPAIVVERGPAVGHAWTSKYDSVRQHTLREYNNLPFDRTWKREDPELLPGKVVAEGFAAYTGKYGIDVWTNSEITSCSRNDDQQMWTMQVTTRDPSSALAQTRTIKTRHLAMATGAGVGQPFMPEIPGAGVFSGTIMHQSAFRNAKSFSDKHAVVIGTGTSAHDIAQDCFNNGMHVTMTQRSKTAIYPMPWVAETQKYLWNTDIDTCLADRMGATGPVKIGDELLKVTMATQAKKPEYVKLFDDLDKAGFKVDRESSIMNLIWTRYGGYYIDVGTSKHIANGDIKVKSGLAIKSITENGVLFEDGVEIPADLIVCATGYEQDYRKQVAQVVGDEIAQELPEFWGLTKNGDVRGMMQENRPGLWMIGGTAPQARWTSRFVALAMMLELLGVNNAVV